MVEQRTMRVSEKNPTDKEIKRKTNLPYTFDLIQELREQMHLNISPQRYVWKHPGQI